jgi:hypothetical protein
MQNIKVDKNKLISILETNRSKHLKEYQEAVIEYRKAAKKLLKDALKAIVPETDPIVTDKELKNLYLTLQAPKHYLTQYDLALGMLQLGSEDVVELTVSDYTTYVQDDWQWKDSFKISNSSYLSVSANEFALPKSIG